MTELFRRLRYLMHRGRFDRELADEMAFHKEMAARDGHAPFGNTLRLREESREAWGWTWIDRLAQDLRYAGRMLRRSPGFTLVAILMLAIGIGVNVAAFGFVNAVVFTPFPVRDPGTLLRFERRAPQLFSSDLPYPEMAFFRRYSRSLAAVLALAPGSVRMDAEDKPLRTHFVTGNFFSELGALPMLGRLLDPTGDERADAAPVAVLSEGFWRRRFSADPSVVGKTIQLNGNAVTVIGVAPESFSGLEMEGPELWMPILQHPHVVDGSRLLTDFMADPSGVTMWGRVRPGVTPATAEEELRSLAAELRKEHPAEMWQGETLPSAPGGYAKISGGGHRGTGAAPTNTRLYSLFAVVGTLVLLILSVACGNLGSLLLARGVAREREIAIRVAVGAGSGRLIRQLFTESLVLASLGSAAGMALGYVVLRILLTRTGAPPWLNPTPDWRVLLFGVGITFLAAILFGLAPALQAVRKRHRATLVRQILVGAQVAASCVLLIVAALLVRAVNRIITTDPGFEYQQVIAINPDLASHGFSPAGAQLYLDTLQARLAALPGVGSVALASTPPLGGKKVVIRTVIDGRPVDAHLNRVDPEFLRTMAIPLRRGRNLARGDSTAVVVSESLALQAWPGEDPIGKEFADHTVIGVCGNARTVALEDAEAVEVYFLAEPADLPSMVVLVKSVGPAPPLVPTVASTTRAIDPRVFPELQLLTERFRGKVQDAELSAAAVALLGVSALLLACLGIVGLVAYAVSERTKEIGIRMALGARPSSVLTAVLRQFSRPVTAGMLVGVGGAAILSQLLRRELYGVSHLDPVAYGAVVAIFTVTVTLAALVPARRALRVDPLRALRHD